MGDAKKIAEKHVFKNSGFGKYTETEVAETLRSSGGDMGGVLIKVSKRESLDDISEENGNAVSGGASRKL